MKTRFAKALRLSFGAAVSGLTLMCHVAVSKAAPISPQPVDLKGETTLTVKVSFEAVRRPLSDLLLDLSQQSGVKLTASAGSLATARVVTARVREMPLSDVLSAFSRLYGVTWTKAGDRQYAMNASGRSELDLRVSQLGNLAWFRHWREHNRNSAPKHLKIAMPVDWPAEILPHVDIKALRASTGVPISSLPEKIQQGLRRVKEEQWAEQIIRAYSIASAESLAANGMLAVGRFYGHREKTPAGEIDVLDPPRVILRVAGHSAPLLDFPLLPPAEEMPAGEAEPERDAGRATPQARK